MAVDLIEMEIEAPATAKQAESTKMLQTLIQRVFKMRTAVSRLSNDVAKLGGASDTVDLRKRVQESINTIKLDAESIKDNLFRLAFAQKNRQLAKVISDFEACLKDFKATMSSAENKQTASLPRQPASHISRPLGLEEGGGGMSVIEPLLQEQHQAQEELVFLREIDYTIAFMEERGQGVQEIQQDIGQVMEMFQDLAVLVNDQGLQLDEIDSNIIRVADATREVGRELGQTEQYQRSARNRMCYILLVVAIVMAVLVIVLVA